MAIAIETLTNEQILVVRESLGLATTDSPTFAGATFSGTVEAADVKAVGVSSTSRIFQSGGFGVLSNQVANIAQWVSGEFNSYGRIGFRIATFPTYIDADAANTLAQRNGTNGQKSRLYKTYTSATSGEWLELDAATDASNFDIAASIGSAGGTARGIRIGGKDAAGTFTPWMSFSTGGYGSAPGSVSTGVLTITGGSPSEISSIARLTFRGSSAFIFHQDSNSFLVGADTDGTASFQGPLIFVPPSSRTLATNGQLTFEATSNTEITVKYRGSDGVTRSSVLTMS